MDSRRPLLVKSWAKKYTNSHFILGLRKAVLGFTEVDTEVEGESRAQGPPVTKAQTLVMNEQFGPRAHIRTTRALAVRQGPQAA